jgi:thymidylate synthase
MTLRSTHTFATLELSPAAYDEIADKLKEAGYGHAFIEHAIDMNGIGLVKAAVAPQPPGVADVIRFNAQNARLFAELCAVAPTSTAFHDTYRGLLSWVLEGKVELNDRTRTRVRVGRGGASFSIDLRNGILPTIGCRKTFPRSAAAEVAWFLLGTQSAAFIHTYAPMWDKFVEELQPGRFGVKAAYGYRWRRYFDRDQIALVLAALREDSSDRRCYVGAWDPATDGLGASGQKNVPCPVGFSVSILDGELHSALTLRSSDVFVGLPYDIMGHALLMNAFAIELGVATGVLHVTLAHAHLYEHHWDMAVEALAQAPVVPQLPFPGWTIEQIVQSPDQYVTDFAAVAKLFEWPEYNPKPFLVE